LNTQVQRFSGRTAEEAVLNAIEALGEDAVVVEAKRVRRAGVFGLFAAEHVEVTARPKRASRPAAARSKARRPEPARAAGTPEAAPAGRVSRRRRKAAAAGATTSAAEAPSFERSLLTALAPTPTVFADEYDADASYDHGYDDGYADDPGWDDGTDQAVVDLTDTIDLRSDPRGPSRLPSTPPSRLPARFSAEDLVPLPEPPPGVAPVATLSLAPAPPVPAGLAVAANPAVIDLRSHAQERARAARLAPPPPPPPQQPLPARPTSVIERLGSRDVTAVHWGRAELRSIGVPEPVLAYLPAADPVSDTVWTMALETAIWWTLRKHRPRANLVVDGYGPEGAMALLVAVLEGHVIRYLHLGDRSVEATPHELAKAVRSCLPR
jgi:hypothetical protein